MSAPAIPSASSARDLLALELTSARPRASAISGAPEGSALVRFHAR